MQNQLCVALYPLAVLQDGDFYALRSIPLGFFLLTSLPASLGHGQVRIDVSKITCDQFAGQNRSTQNYGYIAQWVLSRQESLNDRRYAVRGYLRELMDFYSLRPLRIWTRACSHIRAAPRGLLAASGGDQERPRGIARTKRCRECKSGWVASAPPYWGELTDWTSIEFVFRVCSFLPMIGLDSASACISAAGSARGSGSVLFQSRAKVI